jgi:uncharacterized protein
MTDSDKTGGLLGYSARVRDDLAYMLPMGAFLLCVWLGGYGPRWYVATYVARTVVAAGLLVWLWRHYTKIRWDYWWLGIIGGVLGVVQWVAMEKGLLHFFPNYPRMATGTPFVPFDQPFLSTGSAWTFIAIRWAGASLVVPVMEELFWRDFLWREMLAPNDFKLAAVGERDWRTYLLIAVFFSAVHPQWLTAIVWGLMIGGLLMWKRSLGACIIMHGVTNFLLGAYVLYTREWFFW